MRNRHVLLAGMGRSGTTWLQQIINYRNQFDESFEPFRLLGNLGFEYVQYLSADSILTKRQSVAISNLITLKDRSANTLIKEIRCNMMLRWIQIHTPVSHLVYLIRNPLQVADSWQRLGWNKASDTNKNDFLVICAQEKLLGDYPIIRRVLRLIDKDSPFETYVFLWCVQNLIPSYQLKQKECKLIYYENILLSPKEELQELFKYLDLTFDWPSIQKSVNAASKTYLRSSSQEISSEERLFGWKKSLSREQINRGNEIIECFGLADVYLPSGLPGPASFLQN